VNLVDESRVSTLSFDLIFEIGSSSFTNFAWLAFVNAASAHWY